MARKPPAMAWNSANTAQTSLCGGAVSPVATSALLAAADAAAVDAGATEYASPAHCAELNVVGASDRCIFKAIVPLAVSHLVWRALRCGDNAGQGGAAQTATSASTTTGGGMTAPDVSIAQSGASGAEVFIHLGTTREITGGMTIDDAPAANMARVLQVTEGLAPYAEICEVRQCVGACFEPAYRTADLEAL